MSQQGSAGGFVGRRHDWPVRVYFEDTDASGIVYHARYLAFFERGRSEFLRALGIDHAAALQQSVESRLGFAVRRCQIDYLKPALLDDQLTIRTVLTKLAAAYTDVVQEAFRGEDRLAKASLRVALLDGRGRPARLPGAWRAAMAPYVVQEE